MEATQAGSRLAPLLAPRSVAIVGASPREGSYGRSVLNGVLGGGYQGRLYGVNPNYKDILGLPTAPSLADLPEPVDLAIVAVANAQVEAMVDQAIAAKVRALTIFASCYLPGDTDPRLPERLRRKARAAGLLINGANCLGFHNRDHGLHVCVFETGPVTKGPITVISHSGSAYLSMLMNDRRFGCNLIVSAGQELAVSAADYMAFALDMPTTRVIALFLETVRDPVGFRASLARANAQDVPVVALKVGRTERSAELAQTHSGALAGNDAAYEALFRQYGVQRVDSVDELTATAQLMASPRRYVQGGLGAVLDSGGQRGMMVDLSARLGVPIAEIGDATRDKLAAALEYGLEPVNPVDAWGTGYEADKVFGACLKALSEDPAVGAVALFSDISTADPVSQAFTDALKAAAATGDKPTMLILNWSRVVDPSFHLGVIRDGIPVLDGVQNGLAAIRHAMEYGRFRALPPLAPPPAVDPAIVARWRDRLAKTQPLDENESLDLAAAFGVPTVARRIVTTEAAAVDAAEVLGFPVAIKTAVTGILHKTEAKGVHLKLADADAVRRAWADLAGRLGPRAVVMPMAAPGVEVALGVVMDPQLGPLVMVGAGGELVEVLEDRVFLMPPFDAVRAERAIANLRLARLLAGVRGRPPADTGALVRAAVALGGMAQALEGRLAGLDINPLIVGPQGAVAVDTLAVSRLDS